MGENLQCTKYDTQSERAGAVLSTSSSSTLAPFYADSRNVTTEKSDNLTANHRRKLGLLYNWAAAVGLATAEKAEAQISSFMIMATARTITLLLLCLLAWQMEMMYSVLEPSLISGRPPQPIVLMPVGAQWVTTTTICSTSATTAVTVRDTL